MSIYSEIILSALLIGVLCTLMLLARSVLFSPVPVTKDASIYTLIAVRGDAEHLKQTVDGLLWLQQRGSCMAAL